MGSCCNNTQKKSRVLTLRVATLNYGGVMNSPFQFYNYTFSNDLQKLGKIYMSLIQRYVHNSNFVFHKDTFEWNHSKIQLRFKKNRYSPLYNPDVGIEDGAFILKRRFEQIWDKAYKSECPQEIQEQANPMQVSLVKNFDLLVYHTLLAFCYGEEKQFEVLVLEDCRKYKEMMKKWFSLSFLNEKKKLQKFKKSFQSNQADILIVEEYSTQFENQIADSNQFYIAKDKQNQTMILAKKTCFNNSYTKADFFRSISQKKMKKQLAFLDGLGVAALYVDKFIILGVHLSSKADKNPTDILKLKECLSNLRKLCKNKSIICGGDMNSFLNYDEGFSKKHFFMYPIKANEFTTMKKRTLVQGQFKKSQKIVIESKDKLLSTLPIINKTICYIDGSKPLEKSFVPTEEHPFDHFMVIGDIKIDH